MIVPRGGWLICNFHDPSEIGITAWVCWVFHHFISIDASSRSTLAWRFMQYAYKGREISCFLQCFIRSFYRGFSKKPRKNSEKGSIWGMVQLLHGK
jgi:hypothetical protein